MLYITSILLLFIGLPILIMGIIIIGIRRVLEIEIIKKFFSKLEKLDTKFNKAEDKIIEFLLWFFFLLVMYIVSYPIIFILMIRDIVIKRNTSEITNKTYVGFYTIFTPLLLIWFSGFCFLLNWPSNSIRIFRFTCLIVPLFFSLPKGYSFRNFTSVTFSIFTSTIIIDVSWALCVSTSYINCEYNTTRLKEFVDNRLL